MKDIEKMQGTCEITQTDGEMITLTGSGPVVTMRNYQKEVIAYTKGHGRLFCSLKGYAPCHNAEEVIEKIGYDSERDIENPTGSVFCAHGAGFLVSWDEVKDYMHIESCLAPIKEEKMDEVIEGKSYEEEWIGLDEIDQILNKTFYANQGEKSVWKKRKTARESYYESTQIRSKLNEVREEYLLVDGYNIIYAWEDLKELADLNMDGARIKLLDALCNYQGIRKCQIIAVFDAYRVQGHRTEIMDYHNIHVVYTKEAETADHYIEKFAHIHKHQYTVTVATSDGLEQVIIRGAGCRLLSARELKMEIEYVSQKALENYRATQVSERNLLSDALSEDLKERMESLRKGE